MAESSLLASSLDIPQPLPQSSPAKMARFMAEKDKDLSMLRGNIVRGGTAPFINSMGSSVASASMNLGVTFPKSKGDTHPFLALLLHPTTSFTYVHNMLC